MVSRGCFRAAWATKSAHGAAWVSLMSKKRAEEGVGQRESGSVRAEVAGTGGRRCGRAGGARTWPLFWKRMARGGDAEGARGRPL